MKIQYTFFDGRYTQYYTTDVELVQTHKGHAIYQEVSGWYFVKGYDNWQYFGNINEAKRFIDGLLQQKDK